MRAQDRHINISLLPLKQDYLKVRINLFLALIACLQYVFIFVISGSTIERSLWNCSFFICKYCTHFASSSLSRIWAASTNSDFESLSLRISCIQNLLAKPKLVKLSLEQTILMQEPKTAEIKLLKTHYLSLFTF